MIQLITDSSALCHAKLDELNVKICNLQITINQKTYKEFEELTSHQLLEMINQGHLPTSSQPVIGEKIALYEQVEEVAIDLTMADGLSGTYQSALMARNQVKNADKIHVINTKTLCGPHNYLVEKASSLIKKNETLENILEALQDSIDNSYSFLIPIDFSYLKRGGRLTPLAATVGGLLKIVPVMTQTPDGKQLEKHTIKRSFKSACESVVEALKERIDENYIISISDANNKSGMGIALNAIKAVFPNNEVQLFDLSPAFITQGGPGCVAIQAIKK